MTEEFTTGRDCDAWCTRCKMELAHTIVAMVAGTPVQVKCNTCGGLHKYRAPKKAKAAAAKKTTATKAKAGTSRSKSSAAASSSPTGAALKAIKQRWDELLTKRAGTEGQRYRVTDEYGPQDVLEHPTFGLGFVIEEVAFNRIKVLFEDGERVLVTRHGQRPPGVMDA